MPTALYVVLGVTGVISAVLRAAGPEPQPVLAALWGLFGLVNLIVAWVRYKRTSQ
jgi:hypothetical protein